MNRGSQSILVFFLGEKGHYTCLTGRQVGLQPFLFKEKTNIDLFTTKGSEEVNTVFLGIH